MTYRLTSLRLAGRKGFTLIEVLVASGVMLIIAIVVAATFIQSTKSLAQVEGRVEVVQAARLAANRLQPIFSSGAYIPGKPTLIYPDAFPANSATPKFNERGVQIIGDNPTTWCRYVVLQTTEDSLASGFNPNEIHDLPTMDPAVKAALLRGYRSEAQRIFTYIIWWEGAASDATSLNVLPNEQKVLVIGRVQPEYPNGDTTLDPVIKERPWAGGYDYPGSNPFDDLEIDSSGKLNVRILARGLEDVSFMKRDDAGVQASILAKKRIIAQVGSQEKEFRLESLLQIPSEISI